MSYTERIENAYRGGYAEARPWITFYNTAKIKTTADVARADQRALRDISELETLLADLREYRQALTVRYGELETMEYKYTLELLRVPHWQGRIEYTVTIWKNLADGNQVEELREVYGGKDRRKALDRFAALQRQRPGIEAVQDIERKSWER